MSPKGRPEGESAPKRVSAEGSPASKSSDVPPVLVLPGDLPVFCPNPAMPLWSSHPRVFLDVEDERHGALPLLRHRVPARRRRPRRPP